MAATEAWPANWATLGDSFYLGCTRQHGLANYSHPGISTFTIYNSTLEYSAHALWKHVENGLSFN
jgi:hypothetical protein